jgi:hypothetical protein
MSLSLALATLAILALITIFSIVRANAKREQRIEKAKERGRTRDILKAAIPVYSPPHTVAPIKYDLSLDSIEVTDDISESQYAILKAIFEDEHPDRAFLHKDAAVPVIEDYWADTEPARINK